MTAFLSEWFVWPTAESITNILLPKISTIKPSKGSSIHHFRVSCFKLFIVLKGNCISLIKSCTQQNLCSEIRRENKDENRGWLRCLFDAILVRLVEALWCLFLYEEVADPQGISLVWLSKCQQLLQCVTSFWAFK